MSFGDRLLRSLFVALAVGLAWGIRGDFGGLEGAMYPGVCLGLAFAYVTGQRSVFFRMPQLGVITGIFIGLGGMMSYGILHGYAKSDTFVNYTYGFFTLFMQGGCWGIFGCALVGLVLEAKVVRWWQWIVLPAVVIGGGVLAHAIVVRWIGFHVNPPRGNTSVGFLGAAITLFACLAMMRRPYALRGAVFGFLGFGIGMSFGRYLGNASYFLPWSINHWNVMEVSAGFFGGLLFTFGMLGKKVEKPTDTDGVPVTTLIAMNFALLFIPLNHLITRGNPYEWWPKWQQSLYDYGFDNYEQLCTVNYGLLAAVGISGLVGVPVWARLHAKEKTAWAAFPVLFLSLAMVLFQNLRALYFYYPRPENTINMHTVFWILLGLMVLYALIRRQHEPLTEPWEEVRRVPVGACIALGLGVFLFIIATAQFINGEHTMTSANTRWPLWSWHDGAVSRDR